MSRHKRWVLVIIVFLAPVILFLKKESGMSAFNKQTWSPSEFEKMMRDETMIDVYIPKVNDVLGKVGIEVILPDSRLKNSTIQISSYRLYNKKSMNIYVGPYKEVILLDADQALLGDGTSQDDGFDIPEFTFIDQENRITYTCMQERPVRMWRLNKIVTINFLPNRRLGKNGEPYCYDAYIHHSVKP